MKPEEEVVVPVSLSMDPYAGPWNKEQAAHLLRRTIFGPTFQQITSAVAAGMDATVAQLLTIPPLDPPLAVSANDGIAPIGSTWVNSVYPASNPGVSENSRRESLAAWSMLRINQQPFSIREKMCLFWQNHFAAEFTFDSRATYNYHKLIHTHALGNFKQFVKDITIDPCMLVFLNGATNNVFSPNENFARELLELYTVGKGPQIAPGDYTTFKEEDVLAGAKIMTGWRIQDFNSTTVNNTSSFFHAQIHDTTTKTLSEHFGSVSVPNANENEYSNFIDIIFQHPALATFICRKIYRYFVNYDLTPTVEDTIVAVLAETFINSDYEILPVVEQLLKSDHFYDIALRGTIIKNPIEYMFSIFNATHSVPNYSLGINYQLYFNAYALCTTIGMSYFQPPSVGGWTAYYQAPSFTRLWANSSYIKLRFDFATWVTLAGGITVGTSKWGVNHLAFLNGLSNPSSAPDVIADMITVFCPKGLSATNIMTLKYILTNGLPDFEWTLQYNDYAVNQTNTTVSEPVKTRVALVLDRLFKLPEFQTI